MVSEMVSTRLQHAPSTFHPGIRYAVLYHAVYTLNISINNRNQNQKQRHQQQTATATAARPAGQEGKGYTEQINPDPA
ncbi:hypothetical protein BO94DRAFT_127748 [Aspergillus sclerotioniger CBS 115572]|uniref:Uncharacterized protein n=1 Tax=Aspergillus sclerotioniger CBS 115572 TaxID=1450535 RepID=A0A317XD32_9EURO|nr:hypothetical protein BO94DRAFT_127748 [Aspergillus sclerotioniger CBS 115572]PWY95497.1 hypothetical protein BO94DRAFT_127748 [Aspergillus sclerotioniger CBS 115572]